MEDDSNKDDMTLLNEILNAPSTGEDEFTTEWTAVFGGALSKVSLDNMPAEPDASGEQAGFLPSSLLDTQLTGVYNESLVGAGGEERQRERQIFLFSLFLFCRIIRIESKIAVLAQHYFHHD